MSPPGSSHLIKNIRTQVRQFIVFFSIPQVVSFWSADSPVPLDRVRVQGWQTWQAYLAPWYWKSRLSSLPHKPVLTSFIFYFAYCSPLFQTASFINIPQLWMLFGFIILLVYFSFELSNANYDLDLVMSAIRIRIRRYTNLYICIPPGMFNTTYLGMSTIIRIIRIHIRRICSILLNI